jgi:hypothetical protein
VLASAIDTVCETLATVRFGVSPASDGRGTRRLRSKRLRVPSPIWMKVKTDFDNTWITELLVSNNTTSKAALSVGCLGFIQWLMAAPTTFSVSDAISDLSDLYNEAELLDALSSFIDLGLLEPEAPPVSAIPEKKVTPETKVRSRKRLENGVVSGTARTG